MSKELLFSVTQKDFLFNYTKGSGKGGQKRNKTETAVHCKHIESGAIGYSDKTRSKHQNKIDAWTKCINTKEFKNWHKLEIARRNGVIQSIDDKVDQMMKNIKIEGKSEEGKWIDI